MNELVQRLEAVRGRIAAALARSKRPPDAVRIIAVTKRHPAETVCAAAEAGLTDVGENYAQELVTKMDAVAALGSPAPAPAPAHWHFIGHLQRNKVKLVVGRAALIHAVDSLALAQAIDRQAAQLGVVQPVLVAVNLGGEAQKSGADPAELAALLQAMAGLANVSCRGLMTMPPLAGEPEDSRPYFRQLRALRDSLHSPAMPLPELSMGTTGDFEVAIEEGATLVRIGTAIFGPRS